MIEASAQGANETAGEGSGEEMLGLGGGTAIIGVLLILLGALVQSLQYVFEEKVMSADDDDSDIAPTPPLLLVRYTGCVVVSQFKYILIVSLGLSTFSY